MIKDFQDKYVMPCMAYVFGIFILYTALYFIIYIINYIGDFFVTDEQWFYKILPDIINDVLNVYEWILIIIGLLLTVTLVGIIIWVLGSYALYFIKKAKKEGFKKAIDDELGDRIGLYVLLIFVGIGIGSYIFKWLLGLLIDWLEQTFNGTQQIYIIIGFFISIIVIPGIILWIVEMLKTPGAPKFEGKDDMTERDCHNVDELLKGYDIAIDESGEDSYQQLYESNNKKKGK